MNNIKAKREAYEFLESIGERLNRELLHPAEMHRRIDEIVDSAAGDPTKKHLNGRELAFTNSFAIPILFEALCEYPAMPRDSARHAFLAESFRSLPEYCVASPARRLRHPFNKALNINASEVYKQWLGETARLPLTQSCPDFAIRSPFPYNIVFEAKYFFRGGRSTAVRELVIDAYQAFFYRGLPRDCTETPRPDWNYDYACLLAYDASPEGHFAEAWKRLSTDVKRGFWEGANVYIMILRGET